MPGRRPSATTPVTAVWVAAALAVAALVATTLLALTGELAAGDTAFDPGAAVRYGVPAVRGLQECLAALTVGALVMGTWGVTPGTEPRAVLARLGAGAAGAWFLASALALVLTAAEVAGVAPLSPGFPDLFATFVTQVELGRSLLVSLVLIATTAAVTAIAAADPRPAALGSAAAMSLLAVASIALTGHAASAPDPRNAVDALALHLTGVSVWVGGLAALLLVARRLEGQLPRVVARYSGLAGWCFVLVAGSGVVNSLLRLRSMADLWTAYGLLLALKVAALGILGLAGALHRWRTMPALGVRPRLFVRLASAEVVVMGATIGISVALARSAPPAVPVTDPVVAELGFPVPPPLTAVTWLTAFHASVLWLTVAAVLAAVYVAWTVRLARRGTPWPRHRTVLWLTGCLVLFFLTSGGPAVYGMVSFPARLVQQLALTLAVPLLLVHGAPLTLASRAFPPRPDGSLGPHETVRALARSRELSVLAQPVVAGALLSLGVAAFYATPLFELALVAAPGTTVSTAFFLALGCWNVSSQISVDAGRRRPHLASRAIGLLATTGVLALLGAWLRSGQRLLAPGHWSSIGLTDQAALLADQQLGGALVWVAGGPPLVVLAVLLVLGSARADAPRTPPSPPEAAG